MDFKNTVVIMTSNLGSQYIAEYAATDHEGNIDDTTCGLKSPMPYKATSDPSS